jgi:hypothetical protein
VGAVQPLQQVAQGGAHVDVDKLPDQWYCFMSPIKKSCDVAEEPATPEDSATPAEQPKLSKQAKQKEPAGWVQCDECEKWRRIPETAIPSAQKGRWVCAMNKWDARRALCGAAEDVEEGRGEGERPVLHARRQGQRRQGQRRQGQRRQTARAARSGAAAVTSPHLHLTH